MRYTRKDDSGFVLERTELNVNWSLDLHIQNHHAETIGDASHDRDEKFNRLINKLGSTKAFRRLAEVRFLGALDYCLVPHPNGSPKSARFTRAQHSLGVAKLATLYVRGAKLSEEDQLLCVVAALLHDIGHPPLSHTLEGVFEEQLGIDHHKASIAVIDGSSPLGGELRDEILLLGLNPNDVIDTISGQDEKFGGFFSGPINFDTIEGILRSRSYAKIAQMGLDPERVLISAARRETAEDKQIVDNFWAAKDEVYNVLIRSKAGVMCDKLAVYAMKNEKEKIEVSDFYTTERNLFRKFGILRDVLLGKKSDHFIATLFPDKVLYEQRSFFVDQGVKFDRHQDKLRYRQKKVTKALNINGS